MRVDGPRRLKRFGKHLSQAGGEAMPHSDVPPET